MKTTILIALALVVLTAATVAVESTTAITPPKLIFDLRVHCSGECIKLFRKEFLLGSTRIINNCVNHCVNLIETALADEDTSNEDVFDEITVIDTNKDD
ncbi:hypothetical protein NP493_695g00019 [Ridgeia piscesae]|uniref:Uncharacterized protein n=1 Tax=Ridgeia piscesae TaxID=27915 RepID=A0AAD9KRF1_RIDPI|nr:hypothetical protein NP493_695g00019 [Ridgeia piscesae]